MRNWGDDPFTKKAKKENYEARSIYKLEEIDKRENVFRGVKSVLDLGASPGSWTQHCVKKLPASSKIVSVDISPLGFSNDRVIFLQESIETVDLAPHIEGGKVDLVISDMAPKTSGQHDRDVALSTELAELALATAEKFLKPKGNFVVKLFMGDTFEDYNKKLKSLFEATRVLRPESTRKHSREVFLIGKGFKAK